MASKFVTQLAGLPVPNVFAIGLAVGVGYYLTLFNDGSAEKTKLTALAAQIQTAEVKKVEADKAMKEVEQIRANVGALSDQFKVISQLIPTQISSFEIPTSIDSISQSSGVSLKSTKPETPSRQDILEIIPTTVSFEGTFFQITSFFTELGSLSRIMRLGNFTVKRVANSDNRLSFDGVLLSYRFMGTEADKKDKK